MTTLENIVGKMKPVFCHRNLRNRKHNTLVLEARQHTGSIRVNVTCMYPLAAPHPPSIKIKTNSGERKGMDGFVDFQADRHPSFENTALKRKKQRSSTITSIRRGGNTIRRGGNTIEPDVSEA